MSFKNPCCCPDRCSNKPKPSDKLSIGTILIIMYYYRNFLIIQTICFNFKFFSIKRLLVSITIYFFGGILFMKYFRNSSGLEIIPNLAVWTAIGQNVKVTVLFLLFVI